MALVTINQIATPATVNTGAVFEVEQGGASKKMTLATLFTAVAITGGLTADTFTATGQTSLGGAAGAEAARFVTVVSAVDRFEIIGSVAGGQPFAKVLGSDSTIPMGFNAKDREFNFYTGQNATGLTFRILHNGGIADRNLTVTGGIAASSTNATLAASNGFLDLAGASGQLVQVNQANATMSLRDSSAALDLKCVGLQNSGNNFNLMRFKDDYSSSVTGYRMSGGTTVNILQHDWFTSTAGTAVNRMSLANLGDLTLTKQTSGTTDVLKFVTSNYGSSDAQMIRMQDSGGNTMARMGALYNGTNGLFQVRDLYPSTGINFSVKGTSGTPAAYVEMQAATTGNYPSLRGVGETNTGIDIGGSGTGPFRVVSGGGASVQFQANHTASATHYPIATGTVGAGGVIDTSANKLSLNSAGTNVASVVVKSAKGVLNINAVPTSSAGLATGDIWSNAGVLNIV